MLSKTGIPTEENIKSKYPHETALIKPKAILECYEDIPCNPCETSCPFSAITIGEDINQQPSLDVERCTGCGICIHSCPGLAIMVVQVKENKALFKIPYELLPKPQKGEIWYGVDRAGSVLGDVKILAVSEQKRQDKTLVVQVEANADMLHQFVTIRCKHG